MPNLHLARCPRRRFFLALTVAALAVVVPGCKSKAEKEAEAAQADVGRLQKLVTERHVDALARALPDVATKLAPPLDETGAGAKFVQLREKSEDLRASKRSFFALVDREGVITWVDEPGWEVKGRLMSAGFPPVKDCLDGKGFTRGSGRFGGDPEGALIFVDAAPIKTGDKIEGALVAVWEAIDAADNLQSQLLTDIGMATVTPTKHNKPKEQRKHAMEQADVWVALFRGPVLYMVDDAYQPLEDAAKALDLSGKTSGGAWTGTFDVTNTGWGASAIRMPALGADVGIAVFRHKT